MWIRQILLTVALALLITSPAFQSSPRLVVGTSSTYAVAVIDYNFQPLHINITTGTTVVWTYASNGRDYHTVTSNPNTNKTQGSPLLNSGSLSPGQSFSYTFNQPGYYPYQCSFHPTIMNGWVNVTGAPITPPTSQNPQPDYALIASVAGVVVLAIVATLVFIIRRKKRISPTASTSTESAKA